MEIFKTIEDYPNYEFSNQNRLRNKTKNTFLKLTINNCFSLYKDGKQTRISVSKLKHKYFPEPIIYLLGEIFMIIEEFPNYEISNRGRVYNKETGTFLTPHINKYGYYIVDLYKKNKKKFTIHRLIATAFIPNPKNLSCIDHIDRNRLNNNVENLRWVSHSENRINSLNKRELPKNIYITTNHSGNEYWKIQIRHENFKFCQYYRIDQYSLQQVKEIRDDEYRKHSTDIID